MIGSSVPKISSCITFISSVTLSSTACGMRRPWASGYSGMMVAPLLSVSCFYPTLALLLALVDDRGVIRVVRQRRVEALHRFAVSLDKTLYAVFWHQHVIRGHAGLTGVHGLAEGDAFGGVTQGYGGRNDGRRFAAQLQGDRGEVLGGGAAPGLAGG